MKKILASLLALSLTAASAQQKEIEKDFVSIFDGKTLHGWAGQPGYWRAENGEIVGETTAGNPLKTNTFLMYTGSKPADFELKLDFQVSPTGNTGVNYRSETLPDVPFALRGYQADIDGKNTYTGQNYEERGRGFLAKRGEIAELKADEKPIITGTLSNSDSLKNKIKPGWNELYIIATGNHLRHFVNGILMSDVTDNDADKRKMAGVIGLQMHVGPPMQVRYKNVRLKTL